MANKNLTRDLAVKLIKFEKVLCPKCKKDYLVSRYRYKNQNVEYKCPNCKEVYHPYKLI